MDTTTVVLVLRVALALGCVLGVLWWLGRRAARSGGGQRRTAALTVVARQGLGQKASIAVVDADGRRLLLGVSEHGVTLLTELEAPAPAAQAVQDERVEIDPADLADLVALPTSRVTAGGAVPAQRPAKDQLHLTSPSTPAARMPAVPKPRHPLEGSILDAATWRQAVVAVQERTIRR
jgi:flagellar protein FliO/FliZ